jgi:hypothetical protein
MISRLNRILLALVTAFVFTGQMEAAAQHCATLAQASAGETSAGQTAARQAVAIVASTEHDAPPCHESQTAALKTHAAMGHASGETPDHSGHAGTAPHCECIAALTGWVDIAGATKAAHVEAYAWLSPSETRFASARPDPDLRPPRA